MLPLALATCPRQDMTMPPANTPPPPHSPTPHPQVELPRPLAQRLPFLTASISCALAYFFLHIGAFPEFYLIPLKGAALGLLAVFAWIRHPSVDARILAAAMVVAGMAEMALEVHSLAGHAVYFFYYLIALGLFLHNRREGVAVSQKRAAAALFLLTPLILHLLTSQWLGTAVAAAYGLAMGAMAASAWTSCFPRYRTGAGAVLVLAGSLLSMAGLAGPMQASVMVQEMLWPVSYLGHMLLCVGVIHSLRKRDPQLWLASHNHGSHP